ARGVVARRLPRGPDRAGRRGVHRSAGGFVRGTRSGSDGGEPAGADPRHDPDGALEQVRLDRRRDGEQVGALGRLLDAVRRSRGRLRTAEGRVQDGRVPALAVRELATRLTTDRAPRAEQRAHQPDEHSLPPYPKLDRVLEAYVELDRSREELSQDGFDPDVVDRALAMIDRAEYKRRQAPPGVKLRPQAFGRDRRTPITN